MKKVKYTGDADFREVDAASFKRIGGAKSTKKVVWEGAGDEQELADKSADALVKLHGDEFEIVGEGDTDEPEDDELDDDDDSDDGDSSDLGEGSVETPST